MLRRSLNSNLNAATGDNGKIILWHQEENSNHYKPIELPIKHSQSVYNVSFSPDSKMLASASADGTIELWNLTNYEKVKTFTGHTDEVRNITFSPDGEILASASNDYTIKLWSVKKRKLLITLQGHKATVYALSFSGDNGKTLASGGKDGIILLWNMDGLKLDNLLGSGCAWVRDYLRNNPNFVESDRHLCDDVPRGTTNHNK